MRGTLAALLTTVATALALAALGPGRAYDHQDAPAVRADPSTDLTGVHAWMDGGRLVVALGVFPNAGASEKFSSFALYAVHVTRAPSATPGALETETTILCRFTPSQVITCWPGDDLGETTTGDASQQSGLASASGRFKVFAGLRVDPEQSNVTGLQELFAAVLAQRSGWAPGTDGCPTIVNDAAASLVAMLAHVGGGPAKNTFAGHNVLAIVMSVDLSLIAGTGSILGVWASTNR